jgi:hypothetical protein
VLDRGREEGVVGAQERDAVQRGALGLLVWRHMIWGLSVRAREVVGHFLSKPAAEHRVDVGMRRLRQLGLGKR